MSLGPYDLTAGPFLTLYLMLFAAAAALSIIIPALLRPAGRKQAVTDTGQLAWMSGGTARVAESALTRLMTARVVEQGVGDQFLIERGAASSSHVEAGIIRLHSPTSWRAILGVAGGAEAAIQQKLGAIGLLITPAQMARIRQWQTMPFWLLIAFGIPKLFVGVERERPIGYLSVLLFITLVIAAIRLFIVDRRTGAAIDAVDAARSNNQRLRIAPTHPEMALAVALFGTTVLAGSYYESLHKLRQASSDGGSSSSDSGSDGDGGGCGGGGCGGCGGD